MKSNLKQLREKADFKQCEFAEEVELSQAELSRFENNKRTPTLPIALKIANSLGIKVEEIWSL